MRVRGNRRGSVLAICLLFTVASVTMLTTFHAQTANAAQITARSLDLLTGSTGDGGSKPGGTVNHKFTFTVPSTANVGSIKFEYCTIASVEPCTTPEGLVTTGASLSSTSDGSGDMGFTVNNSTAGAPYITRAPATVNGNTTITVQLNNVVNPLVHNGSGDVVPNYTFFVRITTYKTSTPDDVAADNAVVDTGSVAASTSTQIQLSGVMPESLIFCTGQTIGVNTGDIPDCTTATGSNISFDKLFSPTDTATATSQLAASTNATVGYAITLNGGTLTSGTNTIKAMDDGSGNAAPSSTGVSQFGMNLVANTTPAVGTALTPASDTASDLRGQPTTNYGTADKFLFKTGGDVIARSDFNNDLGPTNAQIYTASYMVNVSGSQPAGTYATTLTYVCTATF